MQNEVDTYGAPVFLPDCSATILAAKTYTSSNKQLYYISMLKTLFSLFYS
jgi:hypothetical protein